MHITLIRHTSVDVAPGTCYGQTDVPLAPTFRQEAEAVRQALQGKTFDGVYSSPLSRCTQLAHYCGFQQVTTDVRLLEMNFGAWEMKRWDEINDPHLERWFADYLHERTTGGESFEDQYERVTQFLAQLQQTGHKHVAIFAHGGVLACARVAAGVTNAEHAFAPITPYGGIVEIEL